MCCRSVRVDGLHRGWVCSRSSIANAGCGLRLVRRILGKTDVEHRRGEIWGNDVSGSDCGTMVIRSNTAAGGLAFNAFRTAGCSATRLADPLVYTSIVIPGGSWTHVAIVVSGTTASTYINGALSRTDTVALVDPGLSPYDYRIAWDGFHQYRGLLSDLAMWNRALSAAEVGTVRTSGVRALPSDPALLISLRADEGSGTTVADMSGRGHPATLMGAARWSTTCPWR